MLADHKIHFHSLDLDQEHSRSSYQKIADRRQEAQSLGATLRFEKVKEALETVFRVVCARSREGLRESHACHPLLQVHSHQHELNRA